METSFQTNAVNMGLGRWGEEGRGVSQLKGCMISPQIGGGGAEDAYLLKEYTDTQ